MEAAKVRPSLTISASVRPTGLWAPGLRNPYTPTNPFSSSCVMKPDYRRQVSTLPHLLSSNASGCLAARTLAIARANVSSATLAVLRAPL